MTATAKAKTQTSKAVNGLESFKEDDLAAQIEALKSDISSISERISSIGQTGVQKAAYKGGKAKADGEEKLQEMLDDAYLQLLEIEGKAGKAVRRNPIQSLGIAAGVGFLAAILMRR